MSNELTFLPAVELARRLAQQKTQRILGLHESHLEKWYLRRGRFEQGCGLLDVEPIRGRGTLLVDQAHANNFSNDELNVLLDRLSARGYDHEFLTNTEELADRLKYANAMLVAAPDSSFESEEVGP